MAIIIPCAGKSSRYPGTRPKYLLTLFDGELMFEKAANPYINDHEIHFIILKEHDQEYGSSQVFEKSYKNKKNIKVHILDNETSGPAETVYMITKDLPEDEPVFIKDCDSFFNAPIRFDNHVCVADLRNNLDVTKVAAKSFAVINDQDMITNIVEKSVASNFICVGGYGFKSAKIFNSAFNKLKDQSGEVFVSHIIKELLDENPFEIQRVKNYIDVGTYEEFVGYNQNKPTIFCDIDGTIFYNQSKYFKNDYSNAPQPIPNAVKYLLKKQTEGSKIIFATSRPSEYKTITETALSDCGFKDFIVLYDLPHSPRLIINDNSITNPYPTALALNVPRDDDKYWLNNSLF